MHGLEQKRPEVAFDRAFQGYQVATDLAGMGFEVVAYGQGYLDMAAPTRRCMELVAEGILNYGENPVMKWMGFNAVAKTGPAGVEKPDKESARERMDGIVALVMSIGRAMMRSRKGGKWLAGREAVVLG